MLPPFRRQRAPRAGIGRRDQAREGVASKGVRMGKWLMQAQALLNTPDITTTKGPRDPCDPGRPPGLRPAAVRGGGAPRSSSATSGGASWIWWESTTGCERSRCRLG
jgi:hypothetical protein